MLNNQTDGQERQSREYIEVHRWKFWI